MTVPPVPYHLHDAGLVRAAVGPRREATLTVVLDEPGATEDRLVHLRFGGIENFADVQSYFNGLPPPRPEAYIARIDAFGYAPGELSRAHRRIYRLELDQLGVLTIRCRNLAARRDDQPEFAFH